MDFSVRGDKIYINTEENKIVKGEVFTEEEVKFMSFTRVVHFSRTDAENEREGLLRYYEDEMRIFKLVCLKKINGSFSVGDMEDYLGKDLPNSLPGRFKIRNGGKSLFCVQVCS